MPLGCACLRVNRPEEARQIVEVTRNANDYVVADDERRHGRPIALGGIGHRDNPAYRAIFGVERYQMRVRGQKEKIST